MSLDWVGSQSVCWMLDYHQVLIHRETAKIVLFWIVLFFVDRDHLIEMYGYVVLLSRFSTYRDCPVLR